mgnify:CR=1 FL=1
MAIQDFAGLGMLLCLLFLMHGPFVGQHEVLASGPIEDLIAHREHR